MADPYVTARRRLVELLYWRGWLPEFPNVDAAIATLTQDKLDAVLSEFQSFAGKPADEADLGRRFCALPDRAALRTSICKWPHTRITWTLTGSFPGVSSRATLDAFKEAWESWRRVCGIEPENVQSSRPNVLSTTGSIDGPGRTLAWSELPCGVQASATLTQKYDTREPWDADMLLAVPCHEIGHALGLDHLAAGNLLAPFYDPRIKAPQAGDIAEAQKLYGPPIIQPPPPPQPGVEMVIRVRGGLVTIDGYKIVKEA